MNIPQPAFPIVAAVAAALIGGAISFIITILSKEQKTSDYRQIWIDAVRCDISDYLAMIGTLSAFVLHNNSKGPTSAENYFTERHDDYIKLDALLIRITLRLNAKNDKKLIGQIKEIKLLLKADPTNELYLTNISNLCEDIISEYGFMLKSEWKRVKRGEPTFFITKWASLAVLLWGIWLTHHFSIEPSKLNTFSSPNKNDALTIIKNPNN
jgi:hypothetical protein